MIDFTGVDTKTLVAAHNACAEMLGVAPVARFADRKTAERRTQFALSLIEPTRRPEPFRERASEKAFFDEATGRNAREFMEKTAPVDESPKSPRVPLGTKRDAALAAEVAKPTPPVASKADRWRRPKSIPPAKVAHRPRPLTLQSKMYDLLRVPGGVLVEDFVAAMEATGAKGWWPANVWGSVAFLFSSSRGYGVRFDGSRIELVVPADERVSPPRKSKKA
jgi:hypothetical protein